MIFVKISSRKAIPPTNPSIKRGTRAHFSKDFYWEIFIEIMN